MQPAYSAALPVGLGQQPPAYFNQGNQPGQPPLAHTVYENSWLSQN